MAKKGEMMLKLKNITKVYGSGDEKVEALKGVSIDFRESEFVSILGQSGGGKTTLLNIIGGLDRYTSGDLIINGKSTKDFKDRDWDAYRNYSIGFVFQSYNLIGHQSVLSNVELALTISGVSRKERRKRAIKALEEVGLRDQIHKKPNQLSGGQMQRVAIARALVNNPDIILADEPTGALDTKTSVQVMEILKNISKDKLIIMVTHNPDLAEKYSSRIIKILDGKITDDSNPYKIEKDKSEYKEDNNNDDNVENSKISNSKNNSNAIKSKTVKRATSMKFFTAFRLSLNNLLTKKGRTILTSFAGSIGIIGIALILAISTGIQNYIDKVEEDTLSSYPLTIEETTIDMSSMIESLMGETQNEHDTKNEGTIHSSDIMDTLMSTLSSKVETNNLEELKKHIEETDNEIKNSSNAIQYSYNLNLNLYKKIENDEKIVQVNPSTVMDYMGMGDFIEASSNNSFMPVSASSSMVSQYNVWTEMLDNEELLKSQYDLLAGKWPKAYNEVVLIVGQNNEISDYTLYTLGLKNQDELEEKMKAIQNGEEVQKSEETSYTYDEMLNLSYKLLLNSDYYNKENGIWMDKSDDDAFMKEKIQNAEDINIVGIIRQNDQTVATGMTGGIGYTKELKEYVIEKSNNSDIAKEQMENENINVFSGLEFPSNSNEKFDSNSLTQEQRMQMANLSSEEIVKLMEAYTENQNSNYDKNLEKIGAIDLNKPTGISIYPKDFESKDKITNAIEEYNQTQRDNGKEENTINYTDIVGTMMKSVSQIVNTVSYVLIAFVAISLIVSSIMIGIITYISVLERTKEIGILRAIGASKKDISRVFNAETLIVGLTSGIIGIGVTVLLTLPINKIIYALTEVKVITTVPFVAGVILVVISMLLTLIAGLIPSRLASKKDPVIALRTE